MGGHLTACKASSTPVINMYLGVAYQTTKHLLGSTIYHAAILSPVIPNTVRLGTIRDTSDPTGIFNHRPEARTQQER